MYKKNTPINPPIGLDLFRQMLNGKWKINLLYCIAQGVTHLNDLQISIPLASKKNLHAELVQLVEYGLISEKDDGKESTKEEYALTSLGKSLSLIIDEINDWAEAHKKQLLEIVEEKANAPTLEENDLQNEDS